MRPRNRPVIVLGALTGMMLIGIALWLFIAPPAEADKDIRIHTLLLGAYGFWRMYRAWKRWKELKNHS